MKHLTDENGYQKTSEGPRRWRIRGGVGITAMAAMLASGCTVSKMVEGNQFNSVQATGATCAIYTANPNGGWHTTPLSHSQLPHSYRLDGSAGVQVDYLPNWQNPDFHHVNSKIGIQHLAASVSKHGGRYEIVLPATNTTRLGIDHKTLAVVIPKALPTNNLLLDILTQDTPNTAVNVHVVADGTLTQFSETLGCITDNAAGTQATISLPSQ